VKALKIISFAISLILMISVLPVAASANNNSEGLVYTAIGDSIAAGYALGSYTDDGCTPKEGYVSLLAEKLGASKINDLAVSGIDTDGVLYLLNNDEKYKECVKNSDIITVSLGSNDLLGPGINMIAAAVTGDPDASPDELLELFASVSVSEALAFSEKIYKYVSQPEQAAQLEEIDKKFQTNWTAFIDKVKELNPTAELIVTDYYNPYYVFDAILKDDIVQPLLDKFNKYINEHEYNNTVYRIAEINELGAMLGYSNVNLLFGQMDVHPSAKGHDYIARRIWSVYSGEPFEDPNVNEEDATSTSASTTTAAPTTSTAPAATSDSSAPKKGCAGFSAVSVFTVYVISFSAILSVNKLTHRR